MTETRQQAIQYARNHHEEFLAQLSELVRIPSVSTAPEHHVDIQTTAEKIRDLLLQSGFSTARLMPTQGSPIVYAENLSAGPTEPTVLIYGHYDVQPADPLDQWETGPFEPTVRDGRLYGRGASDMKGQVVATLAALQAIHAAAGQFPVNVKAMIEGEEEIGSPHLSPFIQEHRELLACDVSLNPDAGMIAEDMPTLVYALRGLASFELKVFGPSHDLHSGVFGGVVHNPAQAMAEVLAGLHDVNGAITLPGFYDRVRPLSQEEREELARLPMGDSFYLDQTGVAALWGEKEYTPAERAGARPTLEINGLYSGFIGEGSKTVIPAYAMAKLTSRLVADQDPKEVYQQLHAYLAEHLPPTVRWELTYFSGGAACATSPHSPAAQAMAKALETAWSIRPVFKREGGSIPVVADIQKMLGADSVLTGFGLPSDLIHSPNEHLNLRLWYLGIESLVHFFYNYGQTEG
jgi:acetylornithine deacetylase/succinyl-diaminopimelate desuccinylase-like protein